MLILKRAFQHEYLLAAPMLMCVEPRPRCPAHKGHVFTGGRMQRQNREPLDKAGGEPGFAGINMKLPLILCIKLMQLHQNGASLIGMRCVAGANRIAHICPRWIIAAFIGKHPLKHQIFLAALMGVGLKS